MMQCVMIAAVAFDQPIAYTQIPSARGRVHHHGVSLLEISCRDLPLYPAQDSSTSYDTCCIVPHPTSSIEPFARTIPRPLTLVQVPCATSWLLMRSCSIKGYSERYNWTSTERMRLSKIDRVP